MHALATPGCPPGREERRLRDRDAGRPPGRGSARRVVRPCRRHGPTPPPAAAKRDHRLPRHLGGLVTDVTAAARPRASGRGRKPALDRARVGRRPPLRLRGGPLCGGVARPAPPPPCRRRDRLRSACRGDARDCLLAELARHLVGMAPAHADRLRARRVCSQAPVARGALQRPLPRRDSRVDPRGEHPLRRSSGLHDVLRTGEARTRYSGC